jgi:hypothetical protein
MKISFPRYGPGELLTRKRGATRIISFVAIAFFAAVCGSYLFGSKLWLLTIAVLGIAGSLLCLGAGVAIFFNQSEVNEAPSGKEAPSASINENGPRIIPQWDYRPQKPIRAPLVFDRAGAETSDVPGSEPFMTNNNVWFNDDSLECATPTFINGPSDAEEPIAEALPQTTDSVCAASTVDDAALSTYD